MTYKERMEEKIQQITENPSLWCDKEFVEELSCYNLPDKFIIEHSNKLNWDNLCIYKHMSNKLMAQMYDHLDWSLVCWGQRLTEWFMELFIDELEWKGISRRQKLSEEFVFRHLDKINLDELLCNEKSKFSLEFWRTILTVVPDFNIKYVSSSKQIFGKDFIREFRNRFEVLTARVLGSKDENLWKELGIESYE